jgi:phosphate:Na+ symporter
MDYISVIFSVIGGVALFLFGLKVLSGGLKKATGEQMKRLLEKLTDRPFKGVLVGTFTTGVIQSSSMTMVTLIGLINAGALTLKQAVGVMLGAEIGTTITAQIVAFKIGTYYMPVISIGFAVWMLSRRQKWRNVGEIMMGFGILFLGMDIMSGSLKTIGNEPFMSQMFADYSASPSLGVVFGALLTGLIQSSSAVTALVIAMGREGIISLPAAIAVILGANIGTTVTGVIASSTSSLSSKRLSVSQVFVNVSGVLLFVPFILPFSSLVAATSADLPRQIANAHTIFNVVVTLALLPFVGALVWVSKKIVPGEEPKVEGGPRYINNELLKTPTLAVQSSRKEIMMMGVLATRMLTYCERILLGRDKRRIKDVMTHEDAVDEIRKALDRFLDKIPVKELSEKDRQRLHVYKHTIGDIERVGDHAVNICQAADVMIKKGLRFSPQAEREMSQMFGKTKRIFETSLKSFREEDFGLAETIKRMERTIDEMDKKYRDNHIRRLERGVCDTSAGIIFVEILRNLERVGDHATNMVGEIMFLKSN